MAHAKAATAPTSRPDGAAVPGPDTLWQADRELLSPGQPVTLTWDNGEGLRFEKRIALDSDYMFTITQRVLNESGQPVNLHTYALASRGGTPQTSGFFILHEGLLGVFDGTLKEIDYDDIQDDKLVEMSSTGGWIGITDKYWLVALIPDQQTQVKGRFLHTMRNNDDRYQVDFLDAGREVAPGTTLETVNRLFVGAKEVRTLDRYEEQYGITNFDLAIDFGWFYFLTKPIFYAIDWLYRLLGNFGLAILALTVVIKLVFFPLANKSYKAMSKLKELQPKMMELRERTGSWQQAVANYHSQTAWRGGRYFARVIRIWENERTRVASIAYTPMPESAAERVDVSGILKPAILRGESAAVHTTVAAVDYRPAPKVLDAAPIKSVHASAAVGLRLSIADGDVSSATETATREEPRVLDPLPALSGPTQMAEAAIPGA